MHLLVRLVLLNRNDDALKAYARATTISRDHATAWNNMGATYIRLQRYDEALPALKAAVAANPADVEALNSLAVAYICLKRYPEAIAPAAEAARLNPKHAYAEVTTWARPHLSPAYPAHSGRERPGGWDPGGYS